MAAEDLHSEIRELEHAMERQDFSNIEEELGDVLFSVVNVARFFDLDSEELRCV